MAISVDSMSTLERRELRRTLRLCKHKVFTPAGVSNREVQDAFDAGLLKFHEWPAGHFEVTASGLHFLRTFEDSDDDGATS